MRKTRASTLLALGAIGAGGGFLVQVALAAAGFPKFRPEYTMALSLLLIAGIVIAFAVPIRQATRGTARARVDPFHATRVVLLAKASSIAGALVTGVGIGLLFELVTRSGGLNSETLLRSLAALGGAIALLVAGLVGEWLCTVPPSDDPDEPEPAPGSVES